MKVIEFLNMFNVLTDKQKQRQLTIEYAFYDELNGDGEMSLDDFALDLESLSESPKFIIVKGK